MTTPTIVRIDLSRCINCSLCRRACPTETINYFSTGRRTHVVDPAGCIGCDICVRVCPVDCIEPDPDYVIDPVQLDAAKERARDWARRRHAMLARRKQRAAAAADAVRPERNGSAAHA
jgi:electron transport complex protein RnfB